MRACRTYLAFVLVVLFVVGLPVAASAAPTVTLIGKRYGDAVADTLLYQYRPTNCYDTLSTIGVGRTGYGEQRTILRFPLTRVAGPEVVSATMRFARSSGSTGFTMRAYRLARPDIAWPQASWNVYRTATPWALGGAGAAGVDYDPSVYAESGSFADFDVTALVRAAVVEGSTTLELLLVDPAPVVGRSVSLYSSEFPLVDSTPVLEVRTR